MKNCRMVFLAVCACALAQGAAAAPTSTKQRDEAEIRRLIQATTDAYARRDPVGAMADYKPDATLDVFDVMPPAHQRGYANSLKATTDVVNGTVGPITMIYQDPVVVVDGDHAASWDVVHMVAHMKSGSTTDVLIRNTDIWQKIDGQWLIIHEHNSFPLDPDAAKKLLNLGAAKNYGG